MIAYQFRPSLARKETRYELDGQSLLCPDGRRLAFADIRLIRLYTVKWGGGVQRCVIWPRHGRAIVLVSSHFISLSNFEDRSETFSPFVTALIGKVAAANPQAIFLTGMPAPLICFWAILLIAVSFVMPLNLALMLIAIFGDGTTASVIIAFVVLAAIAGCLFYFMRMLLRDRSRRFVPD